MNKKEQAEMESLREQLALAKAFRFTEGIKKDVPPPTEFKELSTGWTYNAYSHRVDVACSSSVHHAIGRTDKTDTQKPKWLYSSKIKALRALRCEVEKVFAKQLADIDRRIEKEIEESEGPKGIKSTESPSEAAAE